MITPNKYALYRRNQFGETALIIASENGHTEAAKLLLAATPLFLVFRPRENRQTCLNAAAYVGHLGMLSHIHLYCFSKNKSALTWKKSREYQKP
ncbi:hypothetical protein SUGI_0550540 [Cryptomeria japonica]|nr:hypothetical protein SUGI_0550540 [Cryptomeria japonica]